jgi:uncharacterized protein
MKKLQSNSIGLGLRTEHYSYVEENLDEIELDWFEVISENHFNSQGRPLDILDIVSEKFPISLHGVSMSIAAHENINIDYLNSLNMLIERYKPTIVSDHLCWTGNNKSNLHNLLPFAYNKQNLEHLSNKIDQVQTYLKREISFENLSAYFNYKASTMTEWEFIEQLAKGSGCKLLLDINNIYVNSVNHGFNARLFIDSIPFDKITHIHLAGFSDYEDFLFDSHSKPVYPEVWELYQYTIESKGCIPTLIEWDEDIPEFNILLDEAKKAKAIMDKVTNGF